MARRYWRDPWYWRYWLRQRATFAGKLVLAVAVSSALILLAMEARNRDDVGRPLTLPAISPIFAEEFDDPLRSESILYGRWKQLNPVEAAAYERYADDVKLGILARPPGEVVTPFGRALVAAATIASRSASAPRRRTPSAPGR